MGSRPGPSPPAPAMAPKLLVDITHLLMVLWGMQQHAPTAATVVPIQQGQPAASARGVQPPQAPAATQPDDLDGVMPLREQKMLRVFL